MAESVEAGCAAQGSQERGDAHLLTHLGEKAELVLCEVWLQILDQPFTEALKDKTSPNSRKLRGQLTRWVKWGGGGKSRRPQRGAPKGCSKAMTLFTFSAPQLTTILRPLRPFSQVVVEKFQ